MTESALERLIAAFDVAPLGADGMSFVAGATDGAGRNVVDGSQILAQSMVAAGKALPGRTVRSAHAVFAAAASPALAVAFTVTPVRAGRSFASATVIARQGDRACATATILLDHPEADVIRHDQPAGPDVAGLDGAYPAAMPLPGRQLRIEGVRDHNSPDEIGPPVLDAWLHYDAVPDRDDLRRALLAHFTGHLSISTTMRAHPGIGIGVSFHDPVRWDGWLRYHHESTFAGAGMS